MKIFIVDDDRDMSRNLELLLSGKGYRALSFPSPESALFFLQLNPDMDLLILDYNLKVFTAEYFMEQMKEHLPCHAKVILISGHTDIIEKLNIEKIGVHVFLPKPLDLNMLLQEIESFQNQN